MTKLRFWVVVCLVVTLLMAASGDYRDRLEHAHAQYAIQQLQQELERISSEDYVDIIERHGW